MSFRNKLEKLLGQFYKDSSWENSTLKPYKSPTYKYGINPTAMIDLIAKYEDLFYGGADRERIKRFVRNYE